MLLAQEGRAQPCTGAAVNDVAAIAAASWSTELNARYATSPTTACFMIALQTIKNVLANNIQVLFPVIEL